MRRGILVLRSGMSADRQKSTAHRGNTMNTYTHNTTEAFYCPFTTFSVTVPVPVQEKRTHANESKANTQSAPKRSHTAQPDFVGCHTIVIGKQAKKNNKKKAQVREQKTTKAKATTPKPITEKQARQQLADAYAELNKAIAQKKSRKTAKMHVQQAEMLLVNIINKQVA